MTLIFNRVLEVVKVHAKCHQAKCSGSWVIILTEEIDKKNNTAFASAGRDNDTNKTTECWTIMLEILN